MRRMTVMKQLNSGQESGLSTKAAFLPLHLGLVILARPCVVMDLVFLCFPSCSSPRGLPSRALRFILPLTFSFPLSQLSFVCSLLPFFFNKKNPFFSDTI